MSEFVFKRYEIKFILTPEQHKTVLEEISPYMKMDKYGESTIQSLYYDTPDYLLIRRSIDKPEYKEKIRVRSYGLASENDKVYLEIKKKAFGVVFKRRISLPHKEARDFFTSFNELEQKIWLLGAIYGIAGYDKNDKTKDNEKIAEICELLGISKFKYKKTAISMAFRSIKTMKKAMDESGKTRFRIYTDRRNISLISGHKKENKLKLQKLGYSFAITQEDGTDLRIEALP